MFELYLERKENLSLKVKELLKNKDTPLDVRWELYKETPLELLDTEGYTPGFESETLMPKGEISWYDDFYKDKYETIILPNFIEQLQDFLIESEELDEEAVFLIVNSFKEEILEMGLYSFINAW